MRTVLCWVSKSRCESVCTPRHLLYIACKISRYYCHCLVMVSQEKTFCNQEPGASLQIIDNCKCPDYDNGANPGGSIIIVECYSWGCPVKLTVIHGLQRIRWVENVQLEFNKPLDIMAWDITVCLCNKKREILCVGFSVCVGHACMFVWGEGKQND